MQQNLPHMLNDQQLALPLIDRLDKTELAFSRAFLHAARTLHGYLQEIESSIAADVNSQSEADTIAVVGLFSKLVRSYNSYVLLQLHQDYAGSQVFIPQLWNAAVTLTYLLEVADRENIADYIAVSICQARNLLQEVETELLQFPENVYLLALRDVLQAFITEQKQPAADRSMANLAVDTWGVETANMTAKRATILGLNFLSNPAQQIAQKITPASLLDVRLNYDNSATNGWQASQAQKIDFQQLRDASHLCLHATRALLEEFVQNSNPSQASIQLQELHKFFEWFYQAYKAYSSHSHAFLRPTHNGDKHRSK